MDDLAPSPDIQNEWVRASIERIVERHEHYIKLYPVHDKWFTYWDADEAGLSLIEKPMELNTRYGVSILLTGDPKFKDESRLVFHIYHIIALQFVARERVHECLRPIFDAYSVFQDCGAISISKLSPVSDELKNIKQLYNEMNGVILEEAKTLQGKQVRDIFSKMEEILQTKECSERLKKRISYLKELMACYRKNGIYKTQVAKLGYV